MKIRIFEAASAMFASLSVRSRISRSFDRDECLSVGRLVDSSCLSFSKSLVSRIGTCLLVLAFLLGLCAAPLLAADNGAISGTVTDTTGAVLPGVHVELRNTETGVTQAIETNSSGFYSFPALSIGHYDIVFQRDGFKEYQQTDLVVGVNSLIRIDAKLQVGLLSQRVTVSASALQINTTNAQMGELISETTVVSMPLNGRSYTDLLALQPGVAPVNSGQYSGGFKPSGNLDSGGLSISGNRENFNGFSLNGANVEEGTFGTAGAVPNLDSIAEFRIITNNADAEHGNYAGGMVNVVTKSGTNRFHGDAFEFFRNESLDARSYYQGSRGQYHQNMFGGTFGGPIYRNKLFFFVDYQGTRKTTGVNSEKIDVPSVADKEGDLSDKADDLTESVNGQFFANTLSNRLGYAVTSGEPYYTPNCVSTADCVFPNAIIPERAWDTPASHLLQYLPDPNQPDGTYTTSAYPAQDNDDKFAIRVDADSRWGRLSGYFLQDKYKQADPFGDNNVPGFGSKASGTVRLLTLGATTTFGSYAVNEFRVSAFRNLNFTSIPTGGTGVNLSSLGFAAPDDNGIYPNNPENEGVPQIKLSNSGVVFGIQGYPYKVYNSTYQVRDDFSKVVGLHTLKLGFNYHYDTINSHGVGSISNGQFHFRGHETGDDFADFLIGAPADFNQGGASKTDLETWYLGIYAQDSWRVTSNLVLNYGVRWDVIPFWAESHGKNPTYILGEQSQKFSTAPAGYVFPGDPGVPHHFAPVKYSNISPRFGLAFSPKPSAGFWRRVLGGPGATSIRAGFGLYYTAIEGQSTANTAGAAPYGLYWSSLAPPLFSQPWITRQTGVSQTQRFPLQTSGDINWDQFLPLQGIAAVDPKDVSPYVQAFDLSIQHQLGSNTVMGLSYVGTLGRHLVADLDNNSGIPSACLALSQGSQVMPGTGTCGPNGEDSTYYPISGGVVQSTRGPFGYPFGGNGFYSTIANSSYNAFEAHLQHTSRRLQTLVAYTYSKAMDNSSGYGEQIYSYDPSRSRSLSAFDITHNFVVSYTYELPVDKLFKASNNLTRGWRISGITRLTTGLPVTLSEDDDNSLLGSCNTGPNGNCVDVPNYTPGGKLIINTNPRKDDGAYFSPTQFSNEEIGQFGNSSRRFFHGPGINNTDLSIAKEVTLGGERSLQIRAEFYNAFNHAQFYGSAAVRGEINSGHFGKVVDVADPRIGQLGVKFLF